MFSQESLRFIKYVLIGLFTTGMTYALWSLFDYLLVPLFPDQREKVLSATFFVASFIMIGISLLLNRKITFKDKQRRHEKKSTTIIHFYALYSFSALCASLFVLLIQFALPNQIDVVYKLSGLVVNVGLNYASQRFWIFR